MISNKYKLYSVIDSPHYSPITSLVFHPTNAACCASTSLDGTVKVWQQENANFVNSIILEHNSMKAQTVAFSLDGTVLFAAFDNCLLVYDFASLATLHCAYIHETDAITYVTIDNIIV